MAIVAISIANVQPVYLVSPRNTALQLDKMPVDLKQLP